MQLKQFDIILDIKKNLKNENFEVVQGDMNTNILNITLYDSLQIYSLAGLTVEVAFDKPDGTTVLQDSTNGVTIAGNKIICTLNTNTIAAPGRVLSEVRVFSGSNLLTSAKFEFYVRKSIVNDETVESTNEFPILNQLIEQVGLIEKQVPEQVILDLNEVSDRVGPLASLLTRIKTSIVNAINSLLEDFNEHKAESVSDDAHGFLTDTRFKIGEFTRDMSLGNGDQIISGLGFKPKSIIFLATVPLTVGLMSIGLDDGLSATDIYDNHNVTANTYNHAIVYSISIRPPGANSYSGKVKTFNNDGFTIQWDLVGAVTGIAYVKYLAFL